MDYPTLRKRYVVLKYTNFHNCNILFYSNSQPHECLSYSSGRESKSDVSIQNEELKLILDHNLHILIIYHCNA